MPVFDKLLLVFFGCVMLMTNGSALAAIRLGVLPSSDAVLIHVAHEEGLFTANGLSVTPIPFTSALEISAAMRAGKIDGQYCDLMTVLLQNERGIGQKLIVATTYPNPSQRAFGLAVSPKYANQYPTLASLENVSVAMSSKSIVEYLLDRMIATENLPATALKPVEIRQIQVRLQTVLAGQMATAMLPEPFLTLIEAKGGHVLWDDRRLGEAKSFIALRNEHIDAQTVDGFRRAIRESARRIAADPERYRQLMVEKRLLPKEAASTFEMISAEAIRRTGGLPAMATEEEVSVMAQWLRRKAMIREPVRYEDVVVP